MLTDLLCGWDSFEFFLCVSAMLVDWHAGAFGGMIVCSMADQRYSMMPGPTAGVRRCGKRYLVQANMGQNEMRKFIRIVTDSTKSGAKALEVTSFFHNYVLTLLMKAVSGLLKWSVHSVCVKKQQTALNHDVKQNFLMSWSIK
ncbi:hypothetical protein [Oceanimonas baumannii]|uniref:hypothetical protein n=1 Tax=Oceanimonas baumannii TaxID=129578 RepID=UPI003A8D834B